MDKLTYYRHNGVKLMNRIEDVTGKMMSEIDRELENEFWAAELCKDEKTIRFAYNKLCNLCDSVEMD